MGLLKKLFGDWSILTWCPPSAPAVNSSVDEKFAWVESCNERLTDHLGGGIMQIFLAFAASEHIMKSIVLLLELDQNLSAEGISPRMRRAHGMEAMKRAAQDPTRRQMIHFYWCFFAEAYPLVADKAFAKRIREMSGRFTCMPNIFTQEVLELICDLKKY